VVSVHRLLGEYRMLADQLILEVTEGIVVGNRDGTIAHMQELAAMGTRFSIDDFGTGYLNLTYLKRMPLHELQIDKSFIREMQGMRTARPLCARYWRWLRTCGCG
jgi:EAL domain-containing protein (putative c-di-GMP-specific phosphodiesterase class I)